MKEVKYKNIIKGSFFNVVATFSSFFFNIISTAFLTRLLNPIELGFFISSFSIILIFQIIDWFLPPGMNSAILYFLPKINSERNIKSRNFIISISIIRIFSIFIVCIIYFFFVGILFGNKPILLYILRRFTILLILLELIRTFVNVIISYQKYNYYAILSVLKDGGIFFCILTGFFLINGDFLDYVINSYIFVHFIILALLITYLLYLVKKIKLDDDSKFRFSYNLKEYSKYGSPIALIFIFDYILKDSVKALLVNFKIPFDIVLYSISQNTSNFITMTTASNSSQLISAYSKTDTEVSKDEVDKFYFKVKDVLGFIAILVMLLLFSFGDFYIWIIYTPIYSSAFLLVRIMLIAGFFQFIIDYYSLYFKFRDKTKKLLTIKAIISFLWLITSVLSIVFLTIVWVVIINTLMQFINWIIVIRFLRKNNHIKSSMIKTLKLLGMFLFSSVIIFLLDQTIRYFFPLPLNLIELLLRGCIFLISLIIIFLLNWKFKIVYRELVINLIELRIFPKLINKIIKKIIYIFPSIQK